jgi:tRNA-2-methylthio-N6-dimethylallyladenosine synthase
MDEAWPDGDDKEENKAGKSGMNGMNRAEILVSAEEMEKQRQFSGLIRNLPHRPMSYHVVTYGCQMNAHDSEKIAGMLEDMGMTEAKTREEADFVIFNTCCVRENAERRALGNVTWLKEVRKKKPEMLIAVCGCMIQEPGMAERILKQYKFIDLAFGTANLYKLPEMMHELINSGSRQIVVEDRDVIPEGMPVKRLRHDAAYLTIMYGCDNFCSYCIVPYVRGRERSRDPDTILREAEELQKNGVKEIMLLGQNVNSYGKGLPGNPSFAGLLKKLDGIGIPRIRFMTSHPKDLSDDLVDVMAAGKHILPQFHLPVQSGNNEILKRMNRHYTREQYLDRVKKLREAIPGIGLSTDIIVGFPGETEEQFQDTMSLVNEVRYDSAFTFIYSPRTGTRAAEMPGMLSEEAAAERIQRLIALQEELQKETLKRFVGTQEEILVEGLSRRSDMAVSGKGRHAVSVTVEGSEQDVGQILKCRITGLKNNTLTGEKI